MNPNFTLKAITAAQAHALAEYPHESCGLIVADEYVPVANISPNPTEEFRMPDETWVKYPGIQAVIHSHTRARDLSKPGFDPRAPSAADIACKMEMPEVPAFGIVWVSGRNVVSDPIWFGDFVLDWPLIGREFLSGVTDCYSIIRSHFWQKFQKKIVDFPRDQNWWEKRSASSMYLDNFAAAGFRAIGADEATVDDIALISIHSPVPNHAGVLLGRGILLEHLQGQLSGRKPLSRWRGAIHGYLRFVA